MFQLSNFIMTTTTTSPNKFNRIEQSRHCSPKSNGRPYTSGGNQQRPTNYQTAANTSNSSSRYFYNLNSSHPRSPVNGQVPSAPRNIPNANNSRASPPRSHSNSESSPRGSPTGSFYAGAKFSEPPSPASLPKPPSHWTDLWMATGSCSKQVNRRSGGSQLTTMLINVQA